MDQREFFIFDDGIKIHMKMDFPDCFEENLLLPQEEPSSRISSGDAASAHSRGKKYPLLIVIHGFTGHMEEDHILAVARTANEAGFVSLRAEMYGHGASGGTFRDHTLFKWISNAMAVIDYARQLDFVSDLYLCGHSQGGLLTMLVGAMEQERLRAILPLSPAWMIPETARRGELLGLRFNPLYPPEEMDTDKGLPLGGNYIRAAQMIDVRPAIRRFTKPVLLVHGSADLSVPVRYSELAASLYEDARLVIIPDDTHCYDYHLGQVTAAVRAFLEEMRDGRT